MTLTLFRGGPVFDGAGAEARDGLEVLVEGARIKEVADRPITAEGARVVELRGRCLMPGLIDAHFHALAADADLAKVDAMPSSLLYQHARRILEGALLRGFTSVRDAGGADYGLAMAVASGLIKGPRLFYAGKALSQTGGHGDLRPLEPGSLAGCLCCQGSLALTRVADGVTGVRRAAREELRRGANQIKIMASGGVASPSDPIWNLQYSEEEIRAIVWEAQSWRSYVMAHAYSAESIARCVRFGVRSIEHGNLIDAATARLCAETGAYVVPTLATYAALHRVGRDLGFPEVSLAKLDDVRETGLGALEILKAAGVKMGLGTDLLGEMHRYQLDEFAIRAKVLPAHEILHSATSINAAILNRSGELGVVAPGALADLIVLDGDPVKDIGVLSGEGEGVRLVMKGGTVVKDAM
jgi:imidazolonepropionase-like amidohydrolase